MKTTRELFDIKKLIANTQNEIKGEPYEEEGGTKFWYIEDLIDGHNGTYIPRIVADMFGLPYCQDIDGENYWDEFTGEVESHLYYVAKDLDKECGFKGRYHFGYLDNDCSFGLFYGEDNEED